MNLFLDLFQLTLLGLFLLVLLFDRAFVELLVKAFDSTKDISLQLLKVTLAELISAKAFATAALIVIIAIVLLFVVGAPIPLLSRLALKLVHEGLHGQLLTRPVCSSSFSSLIQLCSTCMMG